MHSGRDAGMGGLGYVPASQGGTHIVERNLTRLTVVVGVIFFTNTIVLYHLFGWREAAEGEARAAAPYCVHSRALEAGA